MNYSILDEDADGVSFFRDETFAMSEIQFAPPAEPMLLSDGVPAEAMVALTLPAGWYGVPHKSPRSQVALILSGVMRVEAGNGDVRDFGPGGMFWMRDVSGGGHASRAMNGDPVHMMIVQFPQA
ncbi:MAG: hypothetical protein KDA50_12735 [Rhodobacteraceae bacterium]|nr:hypothetical protein [Paracoccaceae bacterium]